MARLLVLIIAVLFSCSTAVARADSPGPLADLQARLAAATQRAPGRVGVAIEDLSTGTVSQINANVSMPAASTIKVPVMVEVFRQMSLGKIDLNRKVHLMQSDKDWGWGELCDVPAGSAYTVSDLLWKMITRSDNTATNMLIRLVGRQNINATMRDLGLAHTNVADYIRSDGDIRSLRSSPFDMLHLLTAMARDQLIDGWSSREMIAILEGQTENGLLPAPLPHEMKIAHKTGTLHDTLNDVGIVEDDREPYVIAVMTTGLPTLDLGRSFIRGVSLLAWNAMGRMADWRETNGIAPVDRLIKPFAASPDVQRWLGGGDAAPASTAPVSPADEAPAVQ